MTRRRALIFAAIAAVVALDVALWLRLFTPDATDVSTASREQATAEANEPAPARDDPGTDGEADGESGSGDADTPDSTRLIELGNYTETVGLLETATLSGRYPDAPDGASLYLQRLGEDGWVTFPLPTVVEPSGRFRALAQLGQPGPNRLRMVDPATQTTSDVVSITVR
jgi:hypothetical protein